ncbi:nitrilase-related carbon-nitrogen hydrolase [Actinomadura sp. B10D3]|uniref:nitrilase-related carbon-nitrogen hydrolase n=1 Tax=Actinomadura sp. B10D3 TaxID=3153557 RepID=UPI00325C5B34
MRIAVGQFASTEDWQTNLKTCMGLIDEAAEDGADLLVLPEDSLALFIEEPERIAEAAQPLDGPFVTGLRARTEGSPTTVVAGVHEPAGDGKVFNTLVAVQDGELAAVYRKVHLYDAFGARESDRVAPGDGEPVVLDCAGWRVGLMTCYDVRFPEMARLLVDAGAEVLAVPAAWVRGPAKEWHWQVMVTARALENTCYVAASGECGRRNIGSSMVVDPLGIVRDRLGERPGLLWAIADRDELADARGLLPVLANRRFRVDPSIRPVEESA